MFMRAITPVCFVITLLLWNQSIARAAPPVGDSIVVLNRQIASMILMANASLPVQPVVPRRPTGLEAFSPRTAAAQHKPDWLSNPTCLIMAARLTSAERILHFRHDGFDVNLWGVLNQGRGIRVRFFVRL
jgi:hypothetical protein